MSTCVLKSLLLGRRHYIFVIDQNGFGVFVDFIHVADDHLAILHIRIVLYTQRSRQLGIDQLPYNTRGIFKSRYNKSVILSITMSLSFVIVSVLYLLYQSW